jgi:hypothetical protein
MASVGAAPVSVSKTEFQGDVLDREFKILRDAKTGEYMFDYVEITPDLKKALDTIQYYRLKSTKLSDIETAVKARANGTASPTNTNINTNINTKSGYVPLPNNENNTSGKGAPKPAANGNGSKPGANGNAFANTLNEENKKEKEEKLGSSLLVKEANFQTALTTFKRLKQKNNSGTGLSNSEQKELNTVSTIIDRYEEENPNATNTNTNTNTNSKRDTYTPPLLPESSSKGLVGVVSSRRTPDEIEEHRSYCEAKDSLGKGIPLSNTARAKYKSAVNSYEGKFANVSSIPTCNHTVAPPPAVSVGGRRKTKRSKKSKRKTRKQ